MTIPAALPPTETINLVSLFLAPDVPAGFYILFLAYARAGGTIPFDLIALAAQIFEFAL